MRIERRTVRMLETMCFAAIAATMVACTPIRPLDAQTDGGQAADAGRTDAGRDAATSDAATSDAGCSGPELCNGVDDDCDPTTADGSGDPMLGADCDGADDDLCDEGTLACVGGSLACSDETGSTLESCDGATDEDCDGMVDEAGAEGGTTWYPDVDGDGFGDDAGAISFCVPPAEPPRWITRGGDCDDTNRDVRPSRAEQCNALDDDCDGMIDDGDPCSGCATRSFGGHLYQICTNRRSWDSARASCMDAGYDLVVIDDDAENAFLSAEARATGVGLAMADGWWIGLRTVGLTPVWEWIDGTPLTYEAWEPTQPNGSPPACARIWPTDDAWADTLCGRSNTYYCELTP